ncbi:RNA 2'-phosphotransferase [Burkholderia pseudomallei]|nr:RNA 2'-phosphotransferase [Burkholderia pseudomallei]
MSSSYFIATRASKFLSYVLRHRPDSIGVTLDAQGWADVSELLTKAAAAGMALTLDELKQVVAENDKKRFVLNDDATRIRAAQGHSVDVDLQLPVKAPPPVLYHGTVGKSMADIRKQGLMPMNRHDVHLSPDRETATRVATRRGKPVILVIETYPLLRDGYQFRVSDNGVWLVPEVPAKYIKFPG